ncbi:MAG: FAD-dependent oxidoreductase [Candidatus Koribacter versatilis]|uniref:FAD-dependent oxidoreductase n=1 Tax=Candidatus Korobacter versatilis TaxID=658062 RepID=A0A932EQS0_9BACT|nr:FAD-dependent oxidoreductase [Candidatus Koribacter versatilis]
MARPIYTAKLVRSRWLSDQTRHFEWQVEELDRFDFKAGQFISMLEKKDDGKNVTRAYSIASAPRGRELDLCLNRVPHGFFSNFLCDLTEGAEVHFHGPHGHFILRDPLHDSIFVATGTGVAPMRGFLQWLFAEEHRHAGKHFWLVYGTRYEKDIYYQEEFEALAAAHPNFHYEITVSRPGEAWKGRKGYVQVIVGEITQQLSQEQRHMADVYICGLNNMVTSVRETLIGLGVDPKHIIFERYD